MDQPPRQPLDYATPALDVHRPPRDRRGDLAPIGIFFAAIGFFIWWLNTFGEQPTPRTFLLILCCFVLALLLVLAQFRGPKSN